LFIINLLQVNPDHYIPDVRAKLLLYHSNNEIDTLCMDGYGILYNGVSYYVDDKLMAFIDEN
jgi:hypothetical protein